MTVERRIVDDETIGSAWADRVSPCGPVTRVTLTCHRTGQAAARQFPHLHAWDGLFCGGPARPGEDRRLDQSGGPCAVRAAGASRPVAGLARNPAR